MLDLSPEVREQAIVGLKGRPPDEFVPVLLGKLRYPWAPAADHAAEAIIALGLREAVPELVRMLGEPDPALPTLVNDGLRTYPVVPELVRQYFLGEEYHKHQGYPVVDAQGRLLGVVTKSSLLGDWIAAALKGGGDLAAGPIITYDLLTRAPVTGLANVSASMCRGSAWKS